MQRYIQVVDADVVGEEGIVVAARVGARVA